MTGQDAVNVAGTFDEKIGIDGVVITKLDGDTRGGAALQSEPLQEKPILYAGMGEKLSDLESSSIRSVWLQESSAWAMCFP